MKQYTLTDLHTFIAVVETGSFNKAADRLNTSTASISRRISALEEAMETRLLNRTTRTMRLTDAGRQYYDDVQNVLIGLQESEERLKAGNAVISGSLRVAAPMSFGLERFSPLLPEFLKRHPGIHIDLVLDDRHTDLYAEGIDIALRIGDLKDSSLVATPLCPIEFVYCASPEYLEMHGEPQDYDDLRDHHCLHYSLTQNKGRGYPASEASHFQGQLIANNGKVLCDAAVAGVGIVMLPRFIVNTALNYKQLRIILPDFTPEPTHLYALRLSSRFTPAKVKLMIDYLKEKFETH
ncbi:MAG: LysR family transcriptional regulator [Pseudomonadales bacterium]